MPFRGSQSLSDRPTSAMNFQNFPNNCLPRMPTFLFKVGKIAYLRKSFRFIKSCERYRRDIYPFEWTAQFFSFYLLRQCQIYVDSKEGKAHMSMAVAEPITNLRAVFFSRTNKKKILVHLSCACHSPNVQHGPRCGKFFLFFYTFNALLPSFHFFPSPIPLGA